MLRTNNAKDYWKIINHNSFKNNQNNSAEQIPLHVFLEHFKNMSNIRETETRPKVINSTAINYSNFKY